MGTFLDAINVADDVSGILTAVIAVVTLLTFYRQSRQAWWRELTGYWNAQFNTGEEDGYPLDAHVPPLLKVYVPRTAKPRADPAADAVATDDLVLQDGPHVLLIGPPGSGKTALVRQAAAASAQRWLTSAGRLGRAPDGPLVIRLTAAALAGRTLQHAIAEAAAPWVPELDQEPLPHRRMVILVDGLDALADPQQRSGVINMLAREAATPPRHRRLVVTTRPLGDKELETLAPFDAYHLMPFTEEDVEALAGRWLSDPDPFVAWLGSDPASAKARSPLLVTVAAVLWENGIHGSAPRPAELMEAFVGLLLGARRTALDALFAGPGDTGPDTEWLSRHRRDLLVAAAKTSVDGKDVVTGTLDWIGEQLPGSRPERWREPVTKLLLRTGIFQNGRRGLVPTWTGLVAYLAADRPAPGLDRNTMTTGMGTPSRQAVVGWQFERAGTPEEFIEEMRAAPGGSTDVGRFAAGGLPVPEPVLVEVLATLLTDGSPEARAVLITLAADRAHLEALRALADDESQPRTVRRAAHLFFAGRAVMSVPPPG
ncbi:hypothetical protein GCM10010435_34270 [Winogradskya consettensis]|uniref:NACHT domain-containing protein n=2 Tax=Winogradskya consettensis TaxID=113560 RepID=A0A919SFP6_9ACTN|nr:hypothetical protein Aco04nite_17220 [Actinoplanes consettensis]